MAVLGSQQRLLPGPIIMIQPYVVPPLRLGKLGLTIEIEAVSRLNAILYILPFDHDFNSELQYIF